MNRVYRGNITPSHARLSLIHGLTTVKMRCHGPLDPLSDEETFVMQEILSNLDFEQAFDNDSWLFYDA